MNTYGDLVKSGFHDTTLDSIVCHNSSVIFTIGYHDEDDIEQTVEVLISCLDHVLRDDIPTRGFRMGGSYGSIIDLRQKDQDATLLLQWVNFSPNSRVTCFYQMLGAKIQSMSEPS